MISSRCDRCGGRGADCQAVFLRDLLNANEAIIISLLKAYESADKVTELGVANFIQDRIDIHQKHGWMLKATLK